MGKPGLSAALAALAIALCAAPARADELYNPRVAERSMRPEPMRLAMHEYFAGEKSEGYVFTGAGLVGLGGGAVAAFAAKDDVYRGAGFPLMLFGAIQLAAGVVLLVRTDGQVADLDAKLSEKPRIYFEDETKRMETVRREFRWLEIAELGLAAVGLGLATYGAAERQRFVFGLGAGIALESATMLAFDGIAGARADRYAAALRAFDR